LHPYSLRGSTLFEQFVPYWPAKGVNKISGLVMIDIQTIRDRYNIYEEAKVWLNVKWKLTALNNLTTESNPVWCMVTTKVHINNKKMQVVKKIKTAIDFYLRNSTHLPPFVARLIRNFSCESKYVAGLACPFSANCKKQWDYDLRQGNFWEIKTEHTKKLLRSLENNKICQNKIEDYRLLFLFGLSLDIAFCLLFSKFLYNKFLVGWQYWTLQIIQVLKKLVSICSVKS